MPTSATKPRTGSTPTPVSARPILKWAGGKQQLLPHLLRRVPQSYGRYIEPFVGGGALYFALAPGEAVIADSNPELIALYRAVARDVEGVIAHLRRMPVGEEFFYAERALRFEDLEPARAAARTIYLNKTCFNGLYRVNRHGAFNVPYGRHARPPTVCDAANLRAAAALLRTAEIVCGDYRDVLEAHARAGDFVFLDPPYLPVSRYSDFKRYTARQFREDDHRAMAGVVKTLVERECHVVLTNANHPLIQQLYAGAQLDVIPTRRLVNSRPERRSGEDLIVDFTPRPSARAVP